MVLPVAGHGSPVRAPAGRATWEDKPDLVVQEQPAVAGCRWGAVLGCVPMGRRGPDQVLDDGDTHVNAVVGLLEVAGLRHVIHVMG